MKLPRAFLDADKKKVKAAPTSPDPIALLPKEETQIELPGEAAMAKLDISWLPFAARTYHISPNLSDYVIMNMPMMPSDIPNRNGISFPIEELVAYQPPPMNRQVYKAWTGCPVHLEHDNEDHTKAFGVVFDTSLRQIKGYGGGGKHWMVYGLIGIDKIKNPEIAQQILNKKLNTSSMGCMADKFTCSVCGAEAHENEFMNCSHITSTKNVNWKVVEYMGEKHIAHLRAHGLSPFEHSIVADPAWAPALSDIILQK